MGDTEGKEEVVSSWKNNIWKEIAGCWNKVITEINDINSAKIKEPNEFPTSDMVAYGETPKILKYLKNRYRDEFTNMMHIRRKISPENALILNVPSNLFEFICGNVGENGFSRAVDDFYFRYVSQLHGVYRATFSSILMAVTKKFREDVEAGDVCSLYGFDITEQPSVLERKLEIKENQDKFREAKRIVSAVIRTFRAVGVLPFEL